jgi:hypothetical protein
LVLVNGDGLVAYGLVLVYGYGLVCVYLVLEVVNAVVEDGYLAAVDVVAA